MSEVLDKVLKDTSAKALEENKIKPATQPKIDLKKYGEGDHPYSMIVGNDLLPEVFLGRLSFDSQSHLQTIISKTLNYESSPYMGENWFQRACLVSEK